MSHKVNPKIFRIGTTQQWDSIWFNEKTYKKTLEEDLKIRDFITETFGKGVIEKTRIERKGDKVSISLSSPRPGLVVGRSGEVINRVQKGLVKLLNKKNIEINVEEVRIPDASASVVSQQIAIDLERRVPFRQAVKRAIERILATRVIKGYKILVKGRLNGQEIARKEKFKGGSLPLQTIRADVDYAAYEAHTNTGLIDVKVWLYKGEKI